MPLEDEPVLFLLSFLEELTIIQPPPSVSPPALLAVASSRLRAEPESAASDPSEVSTEGPLAPGDALVSTAGVLLSSGDASLLPKLS